MIFHVDLILYDLILHVVYFFFSALNILIIVTLLFLSSNSIFFFVICTSGSEASFVCLALCHEPQSGLTSLPLLGFC